MRFASEGRTKKTYPNENYAIHQPAFFKATPIPSKYLTTQPVCEACFITNYRRLPVLIDVDEAWCAYCGCSSQKVIYADVDLRFVAHPTMLKAPF